MSSSSSSSSTRSADDKNHQAINEVDQEPKTFLQQQAALFWETCEPSFNMRRFLFQLCVQLCPYPFILLRQVKPSSHGYFLPRTKELIVPFLLQNFTNINIYLMMLSYGMMSRKLFPPGQRLLGDKFMNYDPADYVGRVYTENDVHGFCMYLALLLWFTHRIMSSLKYATMSESEYEKVQRIRTTEEFFEMARQTQLLDSWLYRHDKDLLFNESAAGSILAGVNAAHHYFIIESIADDSDVSNKAQFENWKRFMNYDTSGFIKQKDGTYRVSLLDSCVAMLQYSSNKDNGLSYIQSAMGVLVVILIVLPLLNLAWHGTNSGWTIVCYLTASLGTLQYFCGLTAFLATALIDATRRVTEAIAMGRMVRLSDIDERRDEMAFHDLPAVNSSSNKGKEDENIAANAATKEVSSGDQNLHKSYYEANTPVNYVDVISVLTGTNYSPYVSTKVSQEEGGSRERLNSDSSGNEENETGGGYNRGDDASGSDEAFDPWSKIGFEPSPTDVGSDDLRSKRALEDGANGGLEMVAGGSGDLNQAPDSSSTITATSRSDNSVLRKRRMSTHSESIERQINLLRDRDQNKGQPACWRGGALEIFHIYNMASDIPKLSVFAHGINNIHIWNYMRLVLLYVGERYISRLAIFIPLLTFLIIVLIACILSLLLEDLKQEVPDPFRYPVYILILQFGLVSVFYMTLIIISAYFCAEVNNENDKHRTAMQKIRADCEERKARHFAQPYLDEGMLKKIENNLRITDNCLRSITLFGEMRPFYFCGFAASMRNVSVFVSLFSSYISTVVGIYLTTKMKYENPNGSNSAP